MATSGISFAMSLALFYYATDWGRRIYIYIFSLFLVLLFIDYRRLRHLLGYAGLQRQAAHWVFCVVWPRDLLVSKRNECMLAER
jgi:hypothetical protein